MRLVTSLLLPVLFIFSHSAVAELKTIYVAPEADQQSVPAAETAEQAAEKKRQLAAKAKAKKPTAKLPKESALNFIEPVLGIENVKPWHKGTLAKDEMKPGGRLPTMNKFATKVFASKENTRGGTGIGGGGCGCN